MFNLDDLKEALPEAPEANPKRPKKHRGILLVTFSDIDLLHPRYKVIKQKLLRYGKNLRLITECQTSFAYRLEKAKLFSSSGLLEKMCKLPPEVREFIMLNIQFCGYKHHSKKKIKFKHVDIFNSLPLYKLCKKSYCFLSKYFGLPKPKFLHQTIQQIPIEWGICNSIFQCLEKNVPYILYQSNFEEVTEIKKKLYVCCSLQWDIIPLRAKNKLPFEFNNENNAIENCILVFMVRGVITQWKQPVAFYAVNRIEGQTLKNTIFEVANHLLLYKLRVVATICTPTFINETALKLLNAQENNVNSNFSFFCEEIEIFMLYDPSAMLKQLRELFSRYNIKHGLRGNQKIASFTDINVYYKKVLPNMPAKENKINIAHLRPRGIQKKKTYLATQLFSKHLGNVLSNNIEVEENIPNSVNTGALILYFNNIFDSLNGRKTRLTPEKVKNAPVTKNSQHVSFWKNEKKKLKSMKLICKKRKVEVETTHFDNWFKTITNFGQIYNLIKKDDLKFYTSNLNMESLYSFIGCVYAINESLYLTMSKFLDIVKTMVISSYRPPYFKQAVCFSDQCPLVCNMHMFYEDKSLNFYKSKQVLHQNKFMFLVSEGLMCNTSTRHDFNYFTLSAYIAFKLAMEFKDCNKCYQFFLRQIKQIKVDKKRKLRTIKKVSRHIVHCTSQICSLNLLINYEHFDDYIYQQWLESSFATLKLKCTLHKTQAQLKFYQLIVNIFVKSSMKLANRLAVNFDTRNDQHDPEKMNNLVLEMVKKVQLDISDFDLIDMSTPSRFMS